LLFKESDDDVVRFQAWQWNKVDQLAGDLIADHGHCASVDRAMNNSVTSIEISARSTEMRIPQDIVGQCFNVVLGYEEILRVHAPLQEQIFEQLLNALQTWHLFKVNLEAHLSLMASLRPKEIEASRHFIAPLNQGPQLCDQ
jgi:hypothetical protein